LKLFVFNKEVTISESISTRFIPKVLVSQIWDVVKGIFLQRAGGRVG